MRRKRSRIEDEMTGQYSSRSSFTASVTSVSVQFSHSHLSYTATALIVLLGPPAARRRSKQSGGQKPKLK